MHLGLLSAALRLVRSLFAFLCLLHAYIVAPLVHWWEETVLGSGEELVRTIVRQGFDEGTRFLNGLVAWLLSLFNHHYQDTMRTSWNTHGPWQKWWHQAHNRPTTFNALVAGMKRTSDVSSSAGAADAAVAGSEGQC